MTQQGRTIDLEDSVQLSEYCYNVREILKNTTRGKNASDLNEFGDQAMLLVDLERCASYP